MKLFDVTSDTLAAIIGCMIFSVVVIGSALIGGAA